VTADDIKALVERLKSKRKMHLANASDVECLDALETLTLENQRLRLEFRADCEKQAEELFAVQRDAERYRWLKSKREDFDTMGGASYHATKLWNALGRMPDWDAAIDAARSQSEEEKT
jgi:hypothetical protein